MSKISIIIPIYNGEKYIKRCLDTVINQTYKNIEIICVNDGSKDDSLKLLQEYAAKDERIVIIDKQNAGVSAARNDGIRASTGEYITFVDIDDWLELDAVESLYGALVKNKVDVVRGNYYRNYDYDTNDFKGELHELSNKVFGGDDEELPLQVIDKMVEGKIPCYTWLLLIKKEIILKTLLFKEDVVMMEDLIFYIDLFTKAERVYFMDKPIYHYYCNANSCTMSSEYYIRNMYNVIKVNKYVKEIVKDSLYYSENIIRRIDAYHLNMMYDYIFLIFTSKKFSISEIKLQIDKLSNEEYVKEIVRNADITILPIYLRIPIVLIKSRKYNTLFAFYRIRMIVGKIKDIIAGRKE